MEERKTETPIPKPLNILSKTPTPNSLKEVISVPDTFPDYNEMTHADFNVLEKRLHYLETKSLIDAIEFGCWAYCITEKREDGTRGYEMLGYNSIGEFVKTLKGTKERTFYNKKKIYKLYVQYLKDIPIELFFDLSYSKVLTVSDMIEQVGHDRDKLIALLEEVASLFRDQLMQKYHGKVSKAKYEATFHKDWGKIELTQLKEVWSPIAKPHIFEGKRVRCSFVLVEEDETGGES
jgi:hypothetical protein